MSTSETITRTDLANILNEIGVGATLVNGNVTSNLVSTSSGAITTTNTQKVVISLTHQTVTGRILCIGRLPLMTSRYTSTSRLRVDEFSLDICGTNKTTDDYCTLFAVRDVGIGSHTVDLTIQGQDSGTTAIVPAYRDLRLWAIDLEKGHYNSAIQMADYIVEQGSGYGGTYRKWNSGKCELWISVSASSGLTTSIWQSPIAYADYNYSTLWNGLFNATPIVQASSNHNFIFAIIPTNITKNGLSIRFLTVTALSNYSYAYSLYVVGTWK